MFTTRKSLAALITTAIAATTAFADYAYNPGYAPTYAPAYAPTVNYNLPQQTYSQPYTAPNDQAAYPQAAIPTLSTAQIDQLTASIALYPDPLLAQVLTAATAPADILAAADYVQRYPSIDDYNLSLLPWNPSVKALVHYPGVLQTMAQNAQWSQSLGTAFTYQQADVLNSIQRWRIQAQLSGTLITTPQQQVVVEPACVRIQPVTQVVYVPVYDPVVVYRPQPRRDCNVIAFNYGCSGFAFNLEFDWSNHSVHNHDNNWHNDGPYYGNGHNDGPRYDNTRINTRDARPAIVQQQQPQRVVEQRPAPQPRIVEQRPEQPRVVEQRPAPQPRVTDQHPDIARTAPPTPKIVAQPTPQRDTERAAPPAKQAPAAKPALAQRDNDAPTITKQPPAPKSANDQRKEDQDRKLLALARLKG